MDQEKPPSPDGKAQGSKEAAEHALEHGGQIEDYQLVMTNSSRTGKIHPCYYVKTVKHLFRLGPW